MKNILLNIILFSAILVGASSAQPPPGGGSPLIINEIDYDQPSTDTTEFVEIKNTTQIAISLDGWHLILFNGSSSSLMPYDTVHLPNVMLAADDYFVICGSNNTVPNCDFQMSGSSNLLQNGSPDGMALYNSTLDSIFDAVSYEGDCPAPYVEGTGIPTALADLNGEEYLGLSRFPDGTDTDDNSADFILRCITPGVANTSDSLPCSIPTGIKSFEKEAFSIYPNPTKDKLTLSFNGYKGESAKISIYDITGRVVRNNNISMLDGKGSVWINDLPEGVYILKFNANNGKEVIKKFTVLK